MHPGSFDLHFRLEPNAVSKTAYASRDAIFDDLAGAYQNAIKAFYEAGCRYLQFGDTAWAYLCSQAELQKARDAYRLAAKMTASLPEQRYLALRAARLS